MFKGRTLTELVQELDRQAKTKHDFLAPTNLMEMSVRQPQQRPVQTKERTQFAPPQFQFRVGDKFTGGVTENMHDQLSKELGIPGRYYNRMRSGSIQDQAMAAANINHWLRHGEKTTRLVRTLDGNARAFLSKKYRSLDNYDLANSTLPILLNESKKLGSIQVMSSDVTENKLYIKVASERLTYEVKRGDVVQMGIVISNSEVGHGSVRIEPFLYRLICLNGAIIEDSAVRKYHIGKQSEEVEAAEAVFRDETRVADDKAFFMKLQDVVRAAFNDENFAKLKGMTIDASTRKIQAPIQDVVEEIADRYNLAEKYKDSFLKNLIEGGDTSQWGVANAITAVANSAENYESATDLEKIGGEIVTMDGNRWKELAA